MNHREAPKSAYMAAASTLLIVNDASMGDAAELYIAVGADSRVTAFNGHVDLGTGIRTSLAQIVAEELSVPFEQVDMVLGTTTAAPNQGATIASETIQITAVPLRQAAATARRHLLAKAAEKVGVPIERLRLEDGTIRTDGGENWQLNFGDVVVGSHVRLSIDSNAPLKPPSDYKLVGSSRPRVDIPEKATGRWTYVHDVRVPGMLHGRVIRPPYAGFDHGEHVGNSLISIDETSVAHIDGLVGVVAIGDFVGVVATREEIAIEASGSLKVVWRAPPEWPDLNMPEKALRANPSTPRKLADRGNVDMALAGSAQPMNRTYVWPYQMHGSIGPSCAVADYNDAGLTVWSGTQNPYPMRRDLALLLDMPEEQIRVERLEAAGCYGRNCADDVTADAALLSRAVMAPVRVQLTREQEHAWEPKGAAQIMDVRGGLDLEGGPSAYDFETRYPSNLAPTLPLILTGKLPPVSDVVQMGDRTAIPPYAYGNLRVTVHDMPPIARASWFRGVSAMPNTFAHECYVDELAAAAGVDPVEYRLRYLHDPRAVDLVHALAERAKWVPHTTWGTLGGEGDLHYGRGFAYAVYVHGPFPGKAAAWAAWVADVAVNKKTGEIAVTKVTCAQDSGMMINPDGVRHQIHGNIIQSTSRVLKEKVEFSSTAVQSKEWGGYPLITFPEVPDIDVLMVPRQDEPPLGVGESASVPSAAAIANAVYDATGIRFRELPLTPELVLATLNGKTNETPVAKRRKWWTMGLSAVGAVAALSAIATMASPWRPAIGTIQRPDANVYSAATIERGRLAAAAGACNVCHVGNDGTPFAGGRRFDTPFGAVYATNITPDVQSGIGAWSYPAFERAMREGISRDGHHLYPAHPYTSFAGAEDADLQALYAYMMTQAPVAEKAPETKLKFPYSIRAMMAGWNALFLKAQPFKYVETRDAQWNRGAYLVETLGHCSACHTERNVLGAEKSGSARLAGGFADGWEAPALNAFAKGPVGWTADAFYDYLRTGHSRDHGSAAGPMAHVVEVMQPLPDSDIRAMATYLAGLNEAPADSKAQKQAALAASEAAKASAARISPKGERLFNGACATCHTGNTILSSLALNSNLHAATPDNLIQAILKGVEAPAILAQTTGRQAPEVMSMPAFRQTLNDGQIKDLADYLRARFAPDKPAWMETTKAMQRVTAASH
ncbi:molybdopterin-dependent oxidoreductase [Rhizobium leguminosarum]|uniref:molybdopterin cofactor-binding domain-containing protein n=1 Tax=Rhizobium ruizarguesonis TaxID=2081791 RepID=UPI0013B8D932|nr:molybdopterin cofactor-binding domain-containing protein [Rhizobium ruizarguesonis]MBY5847735.1 molybdopterin-dependent oxidoreductase [Rhizobium leguminosarum]NEH86740.1 molybdopterin-dependent oxidoreductase [Rhizobium ruizarguesonis]NEI15936.1 molybdopterin-dependent oxidoreductase [Rhizobium ruizarguesonis]NEJ59909.1 molybdopterin-dependent oxidoreductase [Rhizobium ruizarguesonis]NEJ65654.1 molybdopterin-dependent oxidoreductase [Rhizobium ruizarguesonis]